MRSIGREYKTVVFDKETLKDAPTAEWVTPGHPLFEAVRELTLTTAEDQLRRGAVFYELGRTSASRLEVFTAAIKDGLGNPLHRRLLVVEVAADGALSIRQPTIFLDLVPGASLDGAFIPPTSGGELEQYLVEHALQPLREEVALERRRELAMVKEHVRIDRRRPLMVALLRWKQLDSALPCPAQNNQRCVGRAHRCDAHAEQRVGLADHLPGGAELPSFSPARPDRCHRRGVVLVVIREQSNDRSGVEDGCLHASAVDHFVDFLGQLSRCPLDSAGEGENVVDLARRVR